MTKLKALLRRVDLYLRNEPYTPPEDDFKLVPIDEIFGDDPKRDPIRTKVYWAIRRFWVNHWLCNPSKVYYDLKYAYQRLTRGWDDRAVWSIDYWLDDKMPAMLRKLKQDKHGIPTSMFDGLPVNEYGYHDEPEMEIAEARWNEVLDKMIAGFEASARVKDGTYEEELGPYPLYRPQNISKEEWREIGNARFLLSQELRKRDEAIFEEGMALFAKHYWSLWD